jgi:hypothetical protein
MRSGMIAFGGRNNGRSIARHCNTPSDELFATAAITVPNDSA